LFLFSVPKSLFSLKDR